MRGFPDVTGKVEFGGIPEMYAENVDESERKKARGLSALPEQQGLVLCRT